MNIRAATSEDRGAIRKVYLSAFPQGEREAVAKLALDLLAEDTTPRTLSLVAESDDLVVGHVAFSPVGIANHETCRAYILAPLAVQSHYQRRGIGSKLQEYGLRQLAIMEVNVVLVYGDPEYYGRFGFNAEAARDFMPPYSLQYPLGWQGKVLKACAIGRAPVAIECVPSLCDPGLW